MGNKTHKTANGQEIDMEQLILKNENVRAVGNMSVNARGDVINNTNKAISARATQVNKNYKKQTGNVAKNVPPAKPVTEVQEKLTGLDEPAPTKATAKGGLAGAMAKASKKPAKKS